MTVLAILEQQGVPLYAELLWTEPTGIPVFPATDPQEYLTVSRHPLGGERRGAGSVSVYYGNISVFYPSKSTLPCTMNLLFTNGPWVAASAFRIFPSGKRSCIDENRIVWASAYASLIQDPEAGYDGYLPWFLRESIARYVEYRFRTGPVYNPRDLLIPSANSFPVSPDG